jgi:hypothetical protein
MVLFKTYQVFIFFFRPCEKLHHFHHAIFVPRFCSAPDPCGRGLESPIIPWMTETQRYATETFVMTPQAYQDVVWAKERRRSLIVAASGVEKAERDRTVPLQARSGVLNT